MFGLTSYTWTYCCVVAVDKAYKLLLDPEQKKRALDVIHAGKEYVEHMVSTQHMVIHFVSMWLSSADLPWFFFNPQQVKEKKKQLKKDGKLQDVEEDDPEVVS